MSKTEFNDLIIQGFDVEFNYKDVFYSITIGAVDGKTYFLLSNEFK